MNKTKKCLLIITSVFVSGVLCAQSIYRTAKIPSRLANISVKKSAIEGDKMYDGVPFETYANVSKNNSPMAISVYSETIIGSTLYDLQSNSSPADRIVVNDDGSIAACWTFEPSDYSGSYINRGTGYAYYDGSTWSAPPSTRIEYARVGWGNIINTLNGRELVLSHNSGAGKLHLASRTVKGTGTWTNSTTALTNVTGGNWWPRMITSSPSGGDTVYVISLTYPVAPGGSLYQGLDGAVVFSRSTDAGLTWDIQNVVPAGLTSANYLGFDSDTYAMAAKGNTVAIVAGDSDSNVTLTKSTDGGLTWTTKTVLQFPLPLWDATTTISDINNDAVADTIETNDGNFAIALDWFGNAYVAYGRMRILNDAPASSANSYNYFPYTDGLLLWHENMPQNIGGTLVASIKDLGMQGTIYFPTPTPSVPVKLPFGSWKCSLTSFPSMAFDAQNNLYISYSSIVDSLMSAVNPEKLVRHQYIMKGWACSPFGVFSPAIDIVPLSPGAEYEGVLGSVAKNVDGYVHILYMRDYFPGNCIPTSPDVDPNTTDFIDPSDMVYVKVSTDSFTPCTVGLNEGKNINPYSTLNFYPNPASNNATIDVTLTETAKLDIAILNSVGQTVYTTAVNGNVGSNKVELNLNSLSAGLYFYQVKIGNSKAITKKFAVEK